MREDDRVAAAFQSVLDQHREGKIDVRLGHLAEVFFVQRAHVAEAVPGVQNHGDRAVGQRRFADGAHLNSPPLRAAGREQEGKQHQDKKAGRFFHGGSPVDV